MPLTYVFSRKTAVWGAVGEFIKDITEGKILLPQRKIPPPPLQEPLLLQTREHVQLPNPSSARPFRAKAQQVFPKALFPVKGFSSLCLAVTVSYRLLNYLLTYLLL